MWKWDPIVSRYRNIETGRFIARETVLGYVEASTLATGLATDDLALMLTDGILGPAEWRLAMRSQIKREYIRQYILGKGGLEQMTQVDWGSIGGMLKEQYGWLNGFTDALPELSEGQITARSKMYINSAREAYERARARVAVDAGYDEEHWVLNIFADHCPDCEEFELRGWQPIGTFPMPGAGETVCLTNCQCSKVYRNSVTGEEWEG